jgi:hypothetical protein
MPERNRQWLRERVDLGARASEEHISADAIRLQEDTVLRALEVLDHEPGVLLADEVGMGKTYQALALMACVVRRVRDEGKRPRILVVTPRPVLNEQWLAAAQRFDEHGFFPFRETLGGIGAFAQCTHLHHLPGLCRTHGVVFAPITVFTSVRGRGERGFLLEAWMRARSLPGPTRAAIRRRITAAGVKFWPQDHFLGRSFDELANAPKKTWARRGSKGGHAGLDDLYARGLEAFESAWAVKKALNRARFHMVRELLPRSFDLLVVDEAHKLKNPWTVQSQAVSQVLSKRYKKAAFLTATPFQLGVGELRRVFDLFGHAKKVRDGFHTDKDTLFQGIHDYQQTYDEFESAWKYAEPAHTEALAPWYRLARSHPHTLPDPPALDDVEDPNVEALARLAWRLRALKDGVVQPGFRRWTVRNLKPGKKDRRSEQIHDLSPDERTVLPILLHERLLLARSRAGHRTHVTAAATNIASSFAAARQGSLVCDSDQPAAVAAYQRVLSQVLDAMHGTHDKVEQVIAETLEAAESKGDKTLIFCERIATIEALASGLDTRWAGRILQDWRKLQPDLDLTSLFGQGSGADRKRGLNEQVRARFLRGQGPLCLALRESYAHTLFIAPGEHRLPAGLWPARKALRKRANELLARVRVSASEADRVDYRVARRCVDQAVAEWIRDHDPAQLHATAPYGANLLDDGYLRFGIDLVEDEEEAHMAGTADHAVRWKISGHIFRSILRPPHRSIWFPIREELGQLDPEERSALVEAVRTFLTRRMVPFLPELLVRAGGLDANAEDVRVALEEWWRKRTCPWRKQLVAFIDYLPSLSNEERLVVYDKALKSGEFVQHTNQAIKRSRLQHAFNTPFFPMVLVGNQQLQEGLNLHRQCRRVVHHDLRWNPADIEQRTGRVDRHGSLSQRLWEASSGEDGHIHVGVPLLRRTIDPRRYRRVKDREKWLEFLLGRPPEVGVGELDEELPAPLPEELSADLRVDLRPVRSSG